MLISLRNTIGSSLTLPFEPTTKALTLISAVAFTVFAAAFCYTVARIVQYCWKPKVDEGTNRKVDELANKLLVNKDSEKNKEYKLVVETNNIAKIIDSNDKKNLNEVNAEKNKTNDLENERLNEDSEKFEEHNLGSDEIAKEIDPEVRKTLNELFKGSKYDSIENLPTFNLNRLFPHFVDDQKNFARTEMTKPVMLGKMSDGSPSIIIKVNSIVTKESQEKFIYYKIGYKVEAIIVLKTNKDLCWNSSGGGRNTPSFFKDNFTYQDGSLVEGEKTNFERLKNLLKTGEGKDINDITWTIPSE